MRFTVLLKLVALCLTVLISCAPAQAGRSIQLALDHSQVLNNGTDTITFDWNITFDTACSQNYQLEIIGPQGTVLTQSFVCQPSPINDTFTWHVPAQIQSGLYTAKLTFFSHLAASGSCVAQDFVDQAQLQFSVCPGASFRVCKFDDLNANGQRDPGEPSLSGWQFTVTGPLITQPIVVTTGVDGCSPIITVPVNPTGTTPYQVLETVKPGWVQTTPPTNPATVQLVPGPNPDVLFGNYTPATFKVCKFHDLNDNGQRDPGEPGLPGWQFTVTGPLLSQPIVVTTGPDGCSNVITVPVNPTGTTIYQVQETLQAGWVQTTPSTNPVNVALTPGANADVVFGNFTPATFKVCKFDDLNANGQQDPGEPGLAGWRFTITGPYLSGPIVAVTGQDGCTSVISVPVNPTGTTDYQVEETLQAGWVQTTPPTNPSTVHLVAGSNANVVFGNFTPATFKVCKFADLNANGQRDPNEPGLSGWQFTITGPLLPQPIIVTTGPDGCSDVITVPVNPTGTTPYQVLETLKPGWVQTTPATNPTTVQLAVGPNPDVVFGNFTPGTFKVCKFDDLNANGVRDPGEPGLSGWQFTITGALLIQPIVVTTGPDGCTSTINVPVNPTGTTPYQVLETVKPGWVQTTPPTNPTTVQLGMGPNPDVVFGNFTPATFQVCKFLDVNGNGHQDPGEPMLSGWQFTITGPLISQPIVVTTGLDGCTPVIAVPVNPTGTTTYHVQETLQPGGWVQTTPATNPFDVALVVGPNPSVLFGNWQPVMVSGFKLLDQAPWPWTSPKYIGPDGQQNPPAFEPVPPCPQPIPPAPCVNPVQPGQLGVGGVTVHLFDNSNPPVLLASTITAPDGSYSFGPIQWRADFKITVDNPAPSPPACEPPLSDVGLQPWPGVYEGTVATSPWPCNIVNFATPHELQITIPTPVISNQEFGCNYFFNWHPARLFGSFCVDAQTSQPSLIVQVSKDGQPWPAGSANAVPPFGLYEVSALPGEPGLRPGVYTLTPPAPADPDTQMWMVTTYCDCVNGNKTFPLPANGSVEICVAAGSDVRVDFCIVPTPNERRCFMPETFTQQGWHNFCDPSNPIITGGMVYNKFRLAFANFTYFGTPYTYKAIIGQGKTITFDGTTSALTRLCFFFPQTGPGGKLDMSYTNPTVTSGGALAGELMALQMNIAYNDQRLMPRTPGYDLEKFVIAEGIFKGKTVRQVRNIANSVLGGASLSSYGLPSYAALVDILAKINANYEFVNFDVYNDRGYLIPNVPVGIGNQGPAIPVIVP